MAQTTTNEAATRECIENCLECHAVCVQTEVRCLELGGMHAAHGHITLLHDCAGICAASADAMLRGSPRHVRFCALCAEVCRECADECARMAGGDALMERCAETCRRCADSCERMAGARLR